MLRNVSKRLGTGLILWIRLAQERVRWRAFVSTVMNIRVNKESRLLLDKLSDYQLFKEYPAQWLGLGIFLFTTASKPALGPIQVPIQWVSGAFTGSKAAGA